jgi:flagellar basal-body rod protein FlgB
MRPVSQKGVSFREPLQHSLDGNTVELAVEQMEFSENSIKYSTTLSFLNSKISGLMSAIRGE